MSLVLFSPGQSSKLLLGLSYPNPVLHSWSYWKSLEEKALTSLGLLCLEFLLLARRILASQPFVLGLLLQSPARHKTL